MTQCNVTRLESSSNNMPIDTCYFVQIESYIVLCRSETCYYYSLCLTTMLLLWKWCNVSPVVTKDDIVSPENVFSNLLVRHKQVVWNQGDRTCNQCNEFLTQDILSSKVQGYS